MSIPTFPDDNVVNKDPKTDNGRVFWLQVGRGLWQRYSGSTGMRSLVFSRTQHASLNLTRAYGRGMQPIDKYITRISPGTQKAGQPTAKTPTAAMQHLSPSEYDPEYRQQSRRGYANIDFTLYSIAPKINRLISGLLKRTNYNIKVESISAKSITEKQRAKYELWTQTIYMPLLKMLEQNQGLAAPRPSFVPKSKQQLEVYATIGGFKLAIETAIEKIIKHTFEISDYDQQIDGFVIEDLKDWNFAALKDYNDPDTHAVKIRHEQPEQLIIQFNKKIRFSDPPFVASHELISIKQFREELEASGTPFNAASLKSLESGTIYSQTNILLGADAIANWVNMDIDPITRSYQYDDHLVQIIRFEYMTKKFRFNTSTPTGKYLVDDEVGKKELPDYSKNKGHKRDLIEYYTRYTGTYAVGTDIIYGVEEMRNQKREKKKTCQSDYHIVKIPGKSITQTLVPLYDELMLIHLKMQNHIVNAKPPGVKVEFGSMNEMVINGSKYDTFDFLQIYAETGNLLYSASIRNGKLVNNGMPVEEMPGGLGPTFTNWIVAYDTCIRKIFDNAGITQAVQASAQISGEKTLGAQKIEVEASDVNLSDISVYRNYLKELAAKGAVLRAITCIHYDKKCEEYYRSVIGDVFVDAILQMDDLTLENWGIYFIPMPDTQEAQAVMQLLSAAMQPGQDGHPTLTPDEYFYVYNCVVHGQIKEAQLYLSECMNRKKEELAAIADQRAKAQQESVSNLEKQKFEQEDVKADKKMKHEIDLIRVKGEEERKTILLQEEEKRKTLKETKPTESLNNPK